MLRFTFVSLVLYLILRGTGSSNRLIFCLKDLRHLCSDGLGIL